MGSDQEKYIGPVQTGGYTTTDTNWHQAELRTIAPTAEDVTSGQGTTVDMVQVDIGVSCTTGPFSVQVGLVNFDDDSDTIDLTSVVQGVDARKVWTLDSGRVTSSGSALRITIEPSTKRTISRKGRLKLVILYRSDTATSSTITFSSHFMLWHRPE